MYKSEGLEDAHYQLILSESKLIRLAMHVTSEYAKYANVEQHDWELLFTGKSCW